MKIGFDFNGVLDYAPNVLFPFIELLQHSGHEVGLITGNTSSVFPKKFKDQFDFTIFCDGPEEEMRACGKIATTDKEKMAWWKAAVLKEEKIDILFDDWADHIEGTTAIRIGPKK